MKDPKQYKKDGVYYVPHGKGMIVVFPAIGEGWEHVAVLVLIAGNQHTPTWDEMCLIKDLFWDEDETVVQYHPKKSEYINNHPRVLHLWKPTRETIPTPPKEFV